MLLRRMADGDNDAGRELFAILYADLRSGAGRLMGYDVRHTLQPTAVVNEAWLKLASVPGENWNSRAHFLGVAGKAMRSVLVDHARAKKAEKRGGNAERIPLDDALKLYEDRAIDLIALDEALAALSTTDEELARLVELRFFSGLTISETAEVMEISTASVERGWRTARSLLRVQLGANGHDDS